MEIIEMRLVTNEWYETELTKTGWDSHGWIFLNDRQPMENDWTIINYLKIDKFGNPFLAMAQKETII